MLDLLEKIGGWFCLAVVVVVGFLYCYSALPPTMPREWVEAITPEPVAAESARRPVSPVAGKNGAHQIPLPDPMTLEYPKVERKIP